MVDIMQKINPRTGMFDMTVDPNSIVIPDGIPAPWDASGGAFPGTTPGTPDRWVISVWGTLPAPVGDVEPTDFIIYDWTSWTVIHAPEVDFLIEVTYAELEALKTAGTLIPGMRYKITDFQNISPLGNTYDEYVTGDLEELVVLATGVDTLSQHAISMQYPQDEITYDFDDNAIMWSVWAYFTDWNNEDTQLVTLIDATKFQIQMTWEFVLNSSFEMYLWDALADGGAWYYPAYSESDYGVLWTYTDLGGNLYEFEILDPSWISTGASCLTSNTADGFIELYFEIISISRNWYIKYRKDTVKNIETNYDFRTVKSRVWAIDLTGKTFVGWTTYNRWNWVLYNNKLYMATFTHSVATNPSTYSREWIEFFDYSNPSTGYCLTSDWTTQRGAIILNADTANYQDIPVFSTDTFDYKDDNISNYKNITSADYNYPVILGNNSNWPSINNVDLGSVWRSIIFRINSFNNVEIKSWYSNTIASWWEHINIDYMINCWITNPRKWNINELKYSVLRNSYNIDWQDISRLYYCAGNIATFGYIYEVIIGNASQQSTRLSIEHAVNTDIMKMTDSHIYWECVGSSVAWNTFSSLVRAKLYGRTSNNVSELALPFANLSGTFYSTINNILNQSATGDYRNFNNNYIGQSMNNNNATEQFSQNYIECVISDNRFTSFYRNGTSANPLDWYIQGNNISYCEENMMYDNSSRIKDNNCFLFSSNQVYWEVNRNNINTFTYNTIALNKLFLENDINLVLYSTFNGNVQWNVGAKLNLVTLNDFYRNIFNTIESIDLSTATIVADSGYSKNIYRNNDGWYSVTYFNSLTGLNYDNITA